VSFQRADIREWVPEQPFGVVFPNAALQWVRDQARSTLASALIQRLFDSVVGTSVGVAGPWLGRRLAPRVERELHHGEQ
jgi:trans-aconitate methyltransferase